MRLKWDLTGSCDEFGKNKQIMLLLFLGKRRTFPRFDLYFHYKQVRVGWKKVDGVDSSHSRLGLLEFVLLKGITCLLSFAGLELQLFYWPGIQALGNECAVAQQDSAARGMRHGEQTWKFTAEDLSVTYACRGHYRLGGGMGGGGEPCLRKPPSL